MSGSIICYRCDGTDVRDARACYICDGKGMLDAERVAYVIDVWIPDAIALFVRTGGQEGLSPSLAKRLLEPLHRLRESFTP